jgi:5-methylcytosine-specific restriction endonuclease McrA
MCQRRYEQNTYIAKWKNGEVSGGTEDGYKTHPTVRRYLLEKANYCCEQCGWTGINPVSKKATVVVDHADGNASNNAEDNLRVLCPNCHSLTPTFGSLNKGNGRPARRAKDRKYHTAISIVAA